MATNAVSRKYTNISFEAVREHLVTILQAKGGSLADYSESSYGRIMIDLFSGTADLMAYYAESSFANSFMESATSRPSVYANARMIGYSVRRPVPAKAGIGVVAVRTGKYNDIRVRIPKGTEFTLGGTTLTAMDNMEFYYNRDQDTDLTGLMTLVSGKAVLAEGVFRTESLVSTGKQNQTFIISDQAFSDYFGDNDPNFDDDGNVAHRSAAFTTVTSDATLMDNIDQSVVIDDKLYWRVSRRGLIDPAKENVINDIDNFVQGTDNYTDNYTVEISTANDGNVQLRFGDGLKSAIPYGVINVTYFATNGEEGNLLNVVGSTLSTTSSKITITQGDGTESDITLNDLNIALTTDIRSGLDVESIDSIKANAPHLFNSLDRLVNRMSYKIFLRRYADVKYATAFGEDILNTKLKNGGIDVKYMNQVRFSVLKSLYRSKDNTYYPTTADEYFLDGYKVNGVMYNWQYDYQELTNKGLTSQSMMTNIATKVGNAMKSYDIDPTIISGVLAKVMPEYPLDRTVFAAQMTPLDFVEDGSELYSVMTALNRRGMITVGGGFHNYVYPSVHCLEARMSVELYRGNNFTDIKERIKNAVYKYLLENTEFATPIYRSRIESIVHTLTEVAGVDVTFAPIDDGYSNLDLKTLTWMGNSTGEYILPGSVSMNGFTYTLQYTSPTGTESNQFTVGGQGRLATMISTYYTEVIEPKLSSAVSPLSDKDIDHFVAYIWEQVMQEVYTPIYNKMQEERAAGHPAMVDKYNELLVAVKGWDKGAVTMYFVDTDYIKGMTEVDGVTLFDYLTYGMEYVKLVRNVLGYYVSKNLIDGNGNITNYSTDNEIVQITIPTDKIDLRVSRESTLLTE